jgi:aspartyl-tRNA(Asn)/glutamyl-tRNA(Gln) amidotransferase subunit B
MVSPEVRSKYRVSIGIECHVQLKTKSKLFSAADNDATEAAPNTLVNHIDFGLPGALPVVNAEALHLASRAAFALGTTPQAFSKFDRKHYFYPDLPMGYQITQFDLPIVIGGEVAIDIGGDQKIIGITRAHLEADAGKSVHPAGKDYTLVDLNRSGTPLLEIVSEPDMHSPEEAKAYVHELYLLMKYADVSEANLYYGNMRFDVNVSVSTTNDLGTRTETKNLNSFRSVEKAAEYEINRQIELLEKGQTIVQETRGWDEAKQKTLSQRGKEEAHDYRYMPDPDLPPITLSPEYIDKVKAEMPPLPGRWRELLAPLKLTRPQIDTLLEAEVDSPDIGYLSLIKKQLENNESAGGLVNMMINIEIPLRREGNLPKLPDEQRARIYEELAKLLKSNQLSSTAAKALLADLLAINEPSNDVAAFAAEKGYIQISDTDEIKAFVKTTIDDNPKAVEELKSGETKVLGFLVGQVMKLSKGKANPKLAEDLIKQALGL